MVKIEEEYCMTVTVQCSDGPLILATNHPCKNLKELNRMSILLPWTKSVEDYIQEIVGLGLSSLDKTKKNSDDTSSDFYGQLTSSITEDEAIKKEKMEAAFSVTVTLQCSDAVLMLATNTLCSNIEELNRMSILLPFSITVEDYIQEVISLGLGSRDKSKTKSEELPSEVFGQLVDSPMFDQFDSDENNDFDDSLWEGKVSAVHKQLSHTPEAEDMDVQMEVIGKDGKEKVIKNVKAKVEVKQENGKNVVCIDTTDLETGDSTILEDIGCDADLNKLLAHDQRFDEHKIKKRELLDNDEDYSNTFPMEFDSAGEATFVLVDDTLDEEFAIDFEDPGPGSEIRRGRGRPRGSTNRDTSVMSRNTASLIARRKLLEKRRQQDSVAISIGAGKVFLRKEPGESHYCHQCGLQFITRHALSKHLHLHAKLPFECPTCLKRFKDEQTLNKHSICHDSNRKYKCVHCINSYDRKKALTKHMYSHYKVPALKKGLNGEDEAYQCSICGSAFTDGRLYSAHMVRHEMTNVETEQYSLERRSTAIRYCSFGDCCRYFLTLSELEDHVSATHGGCPYCGKLFTSKVIYDRHVNSRACQNPEGKIKVSLSAMDVAEKIGETLGQGAEENEKSIQCGPRSEFPYQCKVCPKAYRTPNELHKHYQRVHHKPFKCPGHCNLMFGTRTQVRQHVMEYSNSKPYKCRICGKTFNAKYPYEVHMIIHSGIKPFQCSICGMRFPEKQRMQRHMVVHTTERNFECETCGSKFKTKPALRLHIKTHLPVQPFPCMRCHKGFSRQSHLYRHIKENCHISKNRESFGIKIETSA